MSKTIPFEQAVAAWYDTADRYAEFGASDTEPRGVFVDIIMELYEGKDPVIPTKVSTRSWHERSWQLYSGFKGNGLAAAALTRAARKAVEAGKVDHLGLVRYVKAQGWAW